MTNISSDNVLHDFSIGIGQAEIAAGVLEREPLMIQAQKREKMGLIFDSKNVR